MRYVHRILLDKLEIGFKSNRIIIVVGSRQVGKTTLMNMFRTGIPEDYKSFYFNLEDINSLDVCQNIDKLKAYLSNSSVNIEEQKVFLIIDKFQYIDNATKLFKIFYDLYPKVKILASGSSSIEIQKHMKESLAGRKRIYTLYPLNFAEFVRFKSESEFGRYKKLGFLDVSSVFVETYNRDFLKDYLTFGGYPKVALLGNNIERIEELQDIYNSYVQKDIKSLIKGENISAYNNLLKILSSQVGNLLNVHELSNTLRIGRRIVEKYLSILEQTFIIKLLPPFSSNRRIEIVKMPKIYFMDSGLVNSSLGNFGVIDYRPNIGSIAENFVFCEIIKYKPVHYDVKYWRTKNGTEVDFILSGNDELIPIEVKWKRFTKPIVPKSIVAFFNKYRNTKKAVIVTKAYCDQIKLQGKYIYFIPAVLLSKFLSKK